MILAGHSVQRPRLHLHIRVEILPVANCERDLFLNSFCSDHRCWLVCCRWSTSLRHRLHTKVVSTILLWQSAERLHSQAEGSSILYEQMCKMCVLSAAVSLFHSANAALLLHAWKYGTSSLFLAFLFMWSLKPEMFLALVSVSAAMICQDLHQILLRKIKEIF